MFNCSRNLLKFETEGQEFSKALRSVEKYIWSVNAWKVRTIFERKLCLTSYVLEISTIGTNDWDLDTYRYKLEKKIWILKLWKIYFLFYPLLDFLIKRPIYHKMNMKVYYRNPEIYFLYGHIIFSTKAACRLRHIPT